LGCFGVVDVFDHIGKPFLGIDAVLFACAKEAVKHGYVLSSLMASGKEVVFAAQLMESFP